MSNQADHTIVRLRVPPELKKKIEESAEQNNRSQSAEMVARLEESFTTIQKAKDSQQKLIENTLELQAAFKENLEMQNKLIEQNKALADELRKLKKSH